MMKKRMLALLMVGVMAAFGLTACGGNDTAAAAAADTAEEVTADAEVDAAAEEEVAADDSADAEAGDITVSYVDGFYANDGQGNDFIIAFYEGDAGDLAYVNDGSNEVFAEYVVEDGTMEDGTAYYLVTVGQTQLGYVDNGGEDVAIVDAEGNVYAAAHLSEEEADAIYEALQQ